MSEDEEVLFAQLDGIFDEIEDDKPADYSKIETLDLLTEFNDLTEKLKDELKEAWKPNPKKQASRDLHSRRYALQLELRSRGVPV